MQFAAPISRPRSSADDEMILRHFIKYVIQELNQNIDQQAFIDILLLNHMWRLSDMFVEHKKDILKNYLNGLGAEQSFDELYTLLNLYFPKLSEKQINRIKKQAIEETRKLEIVKANTNFVPPYTRLINHAYSNVGQTLDSSTRYSRSRQSRHKSQFRNSRKKGTRRKSSHFRSKSRRKKR